MFYTLILQTLMDEPQPQLGLSNSDRSRWKLTEQPMIRIRINHVEHKQCPSMTSITQRQESLIRANPGNRIYMVLEKLNMIFSSTPQHRKTLLKDRENKYTVATKQHRGVHKVTLHQPQNGKFFERHERQCRAHGLRRWACCQTSCQKCRGWD